LHADDGGRRRRERGWVSGSEVAAALAEGCGYFRRRHPLADDLSFAKSYAPLTDYVEDLAH
jgi:hypothetical protein